MINLLPEQYKLRFSREYRWRLAVASLVFLDIVIVVALVLLTPSYLYSHAQAQNALGQAMPTGQTTALHTKLLTETATLSATLKALAVTTAEPRFFTTVMDTIDADKTAAESITSVTYTIDPTNTTVTVEFKGIAATRDDLATFVNALQSQKGISNVKVPISDYAADTEVPFDVTLTASQAS